MAEHYYHSESSKQLRKPRQLKPELFASFIDFHKKAFAPGALDLKTKEIIAVAAAHVTQCPFCIDAHPRRAKKAGASDSEIAAQLPTTKLFIGVWVLGGVYALLGALTVAELGTMIPRSGGWY